jgi:hypothetical protein
VGIGTKRERLTTIEVSLDSSPLEERKRKEVQREGVKALISQPWRRRYVAVAASISLPSLNTVVLVVAVRVPPCPYRQ